jgi:hypothetical protein
MSLWSLSPLRLLLTLVLALFFDRKANREETWLHERYPDYQVPRTHEEARSVTLLIGAAGAAHRSDLPGRRRSDTRRLLILSTDIIPIMSNPGLMGRWCYPAKPARGPMLGFCIMGSPPAPVQRGHTCL